MLDGALLQMIEHLIAGDLALAGNIKHFIEIVAIEIADAPGADFAGADQFLERGNGFRQRIRSAPVQQITIEPVGFQPLQRTLAGRDGAAPRRVARQDFRDQENLVAPPRDGFGDHQFRIAIHLGGIDVGHAEIDTPAQRRDRVLAIPLVDIPGALPDHGDLWAVAAEFFVSHVSSHNSLLDSVAHRHRDRGEQKRSSDACIPRNQMRSDASGHPGMTDV